MRLQRHILFEATTSSSQIKKVVYNALETYSGIPKSKIKDSHRLISDLHLDSLDQVEIVMEIEENLNIQIGEDVLPAEMNITVKQLMEIISKVTMIYNQKGKNVATKAVFSLTRRVK